MLTPSGADRCRSRDLVDSCQGVHQGGAVGSRSALHNGNLVGSYQVPAPAPQLSTFSVSATTVCGRWSTMAHCECGAVYRKQIFCGREWCSVCRDEMHERRIARARYRILSLDTVGYWVFTIPPEKREKLKSKTYLTKFARYIIRKLKREFKNLKGLYRWHWFGDKDKTVFHPHLNILTNTGEITREQIERIRREASRKLKCRVVVYHYKYSNKIGKILHWLRYVMKPTIQKKPSLWLQVLIEKIGVRWFGKWEGDERWKGWEKWCSYLDRYSQGLQYPDIQKEPDEVEQALFGCLYGFCWRCGRELRWEIVPNDDFWVQMSGWRELGAGYWERFG
jgi:hypothetical protein